MYLVLHGKEKILQRCFIATERREEEVEEAAVEEIEYLLFCRKQQKTK